jgi:Cu-Zn family superoxide dismutase
MRTTILSLAVAGAFVAGCASMGGATGASAVADLQSTKGNSAKGTVRFTQAGDTVRVSASLSGLMPGAEHGFHVHEKGDCSSGDGMSAGGHYNPAGKPHGPQGAEHHAGDMPNVRADSYGNASATFELHGMSVAGGTADIVGRGLIVHRDPDDYRSQPAGNAGPRIACAVIRRS